MACCGLALLLMSLAVSTMMSGYQLIDVAINRNDVTTTSHSVFNLFTVLSIWCFTASNEVCLCIDYLTSIQWSESVGVSM